MKKSGYDISYQRLLRNISSGCVLFISIFCLHDAIEKNRKRDETSGAKTITVFENRPV